VTRRQYRNADAARRFAFCKEANSSVLEHFYRRVRDLENPRPIEEIRWERRRALLFDNETHETRSLSLSLNREI